MNGAWAGGWVYRNGLHVVAELDASGAVLNRYVYGADPQTPALVIRSGTTYRVVADHLGSVGGVVNTSTGAVAQRRDYSAWGEEEFETGAEIQSLGYAGGLADTLTGLTRFGARDYEAQVGRWTARDPIGFGGKEPNLYAYVSNDPPNRVDHTGMWAGYASTLYNTAEAYGFATTLRPVMQQRFPGEAHSATRHQTMSEIMARRYGVPLARTFGVLNEIQGFERHDIRDLSGRLAGKRRWAFQWEDLKNNEIGFRRALDTTANGIEDRCPD